MLYFYLFITAEGMALTILKRPEVGLIGLMGMGFFVAITLMRVRPLQRGVETTLGESQLEPDVKKQ